MLGQDLVARFKGEHEVAATGSGDFDIRDPAATKAAIALAAPDVVLHAAAYTDVDGCESNRDNAYEVNVLGVQNVALGCLETGAEMLLFSTDYVFNGAASQPYIEWDQPKPLSVYGATKYAGERVIAHILNRYYIVRSAWMYGPGGPNFVKTMLDLAELRDEVSVVTDQIGSPTYTKDVAEGVAKLLESRNYGIYHMVNGGFCSWNEFAEEIFRLAGKDVKVNAITSDRLGRPAKRPAYSVLRNFALEKTIGDPMRPWREALADFLANKEG